MKKRTSFIRHLHPPSVPLETLRFSLSFGLGGICTTLLLLLAGSGLMLLPTYIPGSSGAHASVAALYGPGRLGGWVRNLHYLSANLLVAALVMHLLRVYLTGALDHPARRQNWLVGLGLMLLGLAANFSGYLLPWDQKSYWAVTVFTGMLDYLPLLGPRLAELLRGGGMVGAETLNGFFAFHVTLIPLALLLFSAWHFWLVRRAGGLVRRNPVETGPRVPSVPCLVVREAATGLGLAALVMLAAICIPAPLRAPANPGFSPNPAKAPWYFIGLQELMLHLHPGIAIGVIPMLVLLGLGWVVLKEKNRLPPGIWLGGAKQHLLPAFLALGSGFILAAGLTIADDLWLRPRQSGPADLISRGLLPLLLLIGSPAAALRLLEKRTAIPRPLAGALFLLAGFGFAGGLTLVCYKLRGPGMKLFPAF